MNRKHAEVQKKINFAERAAAMAALDCRKLLRVGMAWLLDVPFRRNEKLSSERCQ
jgi:hypothetical protein